MDQAFDVSDSDYIAPPPPPPGAYRHAGWDAPITEPLPKPSKFAAKPTTAAVARKAGVPVSPHAGHPPQASVAGLAKGSFAAAQAGHVGFDFKALAAKLPTGRDA